MTAPIYPDTQDGSLAGAKRTIDILLRRQQTPDGGPPVSYAYVVGSDSLPAGPTSDSFWWDMAAPTLAGAGPFTNDPDTFSIQTRTVAAGPGVVNSGDFRGLSIDKPGMYLAFKTIEVLTLRSDPTLRTISLYQGSGGVGAGGMIFGDPNHMNQGYGHHMEPWEFGALATPPSGAILLASENGESSAYTCFVSMLVVKLDSQPIQLT